MSDSAAVRLRGVAKRYEKLEERAMLLRSIIPLWRPSRSEIWALRNVDLSIERGETVGVIGRNGAGKTTLLRLLAGVTRPSAGSVEVRGRVAPLLSVGVGFHNEMSGRENVFVNGMLLGLAKREVEERFDEIVAFAELEDFIDTPVKFYSSGMFVRLGFAVAVASEPDVLLVDEVLAVGDVGFQMKCHERMREIQERGTTIVVVSHSAHAIRMLCPRTILLAAGGVAFDGDTQEAIGRHHELLSQSARRSAPAASAGEGPAVEVTDRALLGPDGPTFHPGHGEPLVYRARLEFRRPVADPEVVFEVVSSTGAILYGLRTLAGAWRRFEPGDVAELEIPFRLRLMGDSFRLRIELLDQDGGHLYSESEGLIVFVAPRSGTYGPVDLEGSVVLDGVELPHEVDLILGGYPGGKPSPDADAASQLAPNQ